VTQSLTFAPRSPGITCVYVSTLKLSSCCWVRSCLWLCQTQGFLVLAAVSIVVVNAGMRFFMKGMLCCVGLKQPATGPFSPGVVQRCPLSRGT